MRILTFFLTIILLTQGTTVTWAQVQNNNKEVLNLSVKEVKNKELAQKIKKIQGELTDISTEWMNASQAFEANKHYEGQKEISSASTYIESIKNPIDKVSLCLGYMSIIDPKYFEQGQMKLNNEMTFLNYQAQILLTTSRDQNKDASLYFEITAVNDPLVKNILVQLLNITKETAKIYDEFNSENAS